MYVCVCVCVVLFIGQRMIYMPTSICDLCCRDVKGKQVTRLDAVRRLFEFFLIDLIYSFIAHRIHSLRSRSVGGMEWNGSKPVKSALSHHWTLAPRTDRLYASGEDSTELALPQKKEREKEREKAE